MTQAPHKTETPHNPEPAQTTEPRWAELSEDILDSIEAGRNRGIEAVRSFIDEVKPAVDGESRRKTVVDAALKLTEELVTTQIEFIRSIVRSAGEAANK